MLGERIATARKRIGMSQVELAVAMGDRYNSSMISQVESGQKSLRIDGLSNAAQELRVSTDWLLGLTDDPAPYVELKKRLGELDALENELGKPLAFHDPTAVFEENSEITSANSRHIEIHEVEASAGGGRSIEDAPIKGYLAFQRVWLKRHAIDPRQATVISVAGDSMEPTLSDGCSILVDHNRHTRRKGRIYVLQTEDGLIVKRAGREKAGWQILSDNPYWPPAPWPEDAQIVGEVRWAARTF